MPQVVSRRGSLLRWFILLGVLAAAVGFVAVVLLRPELQTSDHVTAAARPGELEELPFTPMESPPFRTPDTLPPVDPGISPDERVIGVSVGGAHRAYSLKAFDEIDHHVLNDLLAGQPVTVTHCPQTGCTRVYTGPLGRRLQMQLAGWANKSGGDQMVLRLGRMGYFQETGRAVVGAGTIPNPTIDHQVTTLGEWQKKHPDTDLYSGGGVVGY